MPDVALGHFGASESNPSALKLWITSCTRSSDVNAILAIAGTAVGEADPGGVCCGHAQCTLEIFLRQATRLIMQLTDPVDSRGHRAMWCRPDAETVLALPRAGCTDPSCPVVADDDPALSPRVPSAGSAFHGPM